jgi:hypothetical protein
MGPATVGGQANSIHFLVESLDNDCIAALCRTPYDFAPLSVYRQLLSNRRFTAISDQTYAFVVFLMSLQPSSTKDGMNGWGCLEDAGGPRYKRMQVRSG